MAANSTLGDAAFLAAIVASSDDAIVGKTLDGTIVSWNPAAERLYGYSADDVLGRDISLIVPSELRGELRGIFERLARGERVDHHETVRVRKDGSRVEVAVTISPIRDEAGTVIGASAITRDVSLRKQAERAAELERSNAALETFAYVASHDLQEPLRMVASYVQLLARRYAGKLDADADEFIHYAVEGATRMQALINDLLAYARVGANAVYEPVELRGCVDRATSRLQAAIDESGATVTCDELPSVCGDASQLVQLFQNLIGNALKFRSDEPPVVHVAAERGDDEWIVSVRDNGIGVDPRHHEQIFRIFKRLHARDEYAGNGIGLSLCAEIVKRHGGQIVVSSELGAGSTFSFTLPDDARRPAETKGEMNGH